ncbi:MAG: HlyC/CorC family transporter [Deltaproteobacteria bacterium]|nr:HlyC/CorC family transporter [Deltaproteobacteria bacterium]
MLALAAAIACVIANAFFVGAEFALAKVRPTSLEAAARSGDDPEAERTLKILEKLDEYLAATQLGITLASLGLGWLGEPAVAELLEPLLHRLGLGEWTHPVAFAIGFAVISTLHIVVGELVPKSLGITRSEQLARLASRPLRVFYLSVFPGLWLLNRASNLVLRALRLPAPEHAEGKLSLDELRLLIAASLTGEEADKQRELLERVLRATDRPVRAIMVPRVDMQILSLGQDLEAALDRIRRHGFSRYPVCTDDNPDQVVGYVYVKDLLLREGRDRPTLQSLKRDILIVPQSRTVGEMLTEFQRTKIPIALVVDEYGGTSGLVTMEDAVAEIVGDITDELKGASQPRMVEEEDGSVVVDGSLPVDDLELDGTKLPQREDADTVGGYVLGRLGRLAGPGDRIEMAGWVGVVEDVRQRRVHRVRFVKAASPETTEAPKNEA